MGSETSERGHEGWTCSESEERQVGLEGDSVGKLSTSPQILCTELMPTTFRNKD